MATHKVKVSVGRGSWFARVVSQEHQPQWTPLAWGPTGVLFGCEGAKGCIATKVERWDRSMARTLKELLDMGRTA